MLHQLLEKDKVKPARALLVGDRADTDITAGKRARIKTCLVLTGVTTPAETPRLSAAMRPDFVARDLRGVLGLLGIGKHKPAVAWKDFH
jgi:ribonucleotide monophosphatase NagD (HAD superfamily)